MTLERKLEKAKTLVEALPYIKEFAGKTIVIKYGGAAMVEETLKAQFAKDLVLLKLIGVHPVVVHGGGKEISRWMEKLGEEATFIDGLRYTNADSLEIMEMVVSGKINKQISTLINRHGGKAVGLSGKDANLFIGKRITGKNNEDLGLVGEIETTNVGLLTDLIERGYIPVISPVASTREEEIEGLNVNADHVAAGIATALKAQKLIYLTDVQGISIEGNLVEYLDLVEAEELMSHPEIRGGMLPKLDHSIRALKGEVNSVHILDGTIEHSVLLEMFTDSGVGTMLSNQHVNI